MSDFRDLIVYKKSFKLVMEIFEISKKFPDAERYALMDQMRRSSRLVTANLSEAYRKRRYPAHFISKLSDSDMENSETLTWLLFAKECKYITTEIFDKLEKENMEIGKLLNPMINNPEKYSK